MSNVLSTEKKQQVIALGRLGWPLRRIEAATGVRRETAGSYLRAAGIAVRPPGGWGKRAPSKPANGVTTDLEATNPSIKGLSKPDISKPANGVTTDSGSLDLSKLDLPATPEPPSASACAPYREIIELSLSRGRNAMSIWQDLVSDHGFSGSYQSMKRFVRKLRGSQRPGAVGIIQTGPGEEGQVDYGDGPMVRHPKTGKYRRTRLFVMTLGYSRKSVRLLRFRSSSRIWAELHETAFRRLGGSPRCIVLDNLREGVIDPDYYDPTLNPLFKDVLAHYDVVALPCRVRDPDRKGKVESGVGHAKKTPLSASRVWRRRRPIWTDGKPAGLIRASTARPNGRLPPCSPKRSRHCSHCRWNRSATTSTGTASSIWTVAWKWRLPIIVCLPAGSDAPSKCSGIRSTSGSSIQRPISYYASMSARNGRVPCPSRGQSENDAGDHRSIACPGGSCRRSHRRTGQSHPSPPG